MIGHFDVHTSFPEEKKQKLVEVNGNAILYTSLRQILWSIMSNGPFQPLFIPTVMFVPETTNDSNKPAEIKA